MIQDDQSQYTINKTLQRLQQDSDKGSVNITGLPAGEYSVRVYDNMEDYLNNIINPAYEYVEPLKITAFTVPNSVSVFSSTTILSVYSPGKHCNYFENCIT